MKDERKTERNTEWNDEAEADRDFLREKLKNAGDPALPASLSAAALFERMDAADQQADAPKKKGGAIWLQWRRWGSIAAVLVLAAGTAFLLQNSSLQNKASQDESSYDAALAPNEAENRDLWNGSAGEVPETGGPGTDGLMMAPPPNPTTAGGDNKKTESRPDGYFGALESEIIAPTGELRFPRSFSGETMTRRSPCFTIAASAGRAANCPQAAPTILCWIRRCTASSRRSAGWWITAEHAPRC